MCASFVDVPIIKLTRHAHLDRYRLLQLYSEIMLSSLQPPLIYTGILILFATRIRIPVLMGLIIKATPDVGTPPLLRTLH